MWLGTFTLEALRTVNKLTFSHFLFKRRFLSDSRVWLLLLLDASLRLSSERILSIFDHATLKNYISAVIYSSISSYTSLERAKIKLSEKKYFGLSVLYLPEKLCILCNTVQIFFFLQYLSKTARISVENIERLTIFYKFILWPYRIMQMRSELISIAKLDTLASLCGPIFTFEKRFIF